LTVKGDSYAHLLNAAQQQTDLAKGSIEESEARLARLAARHSDIDAIYWLRRQPNTGFLHTTFASSSEAADWGWEEGSENCSDESSSCDSGDETNDCGGTCATASSCVTQ
jgi:hypothetical protein